MGREGVQRIASGGRRPDCRALPDNGTFDQDELQRAGYPYRCRTADLAGGLSPVWIILAAIIGGLVYGLKIKKD